MRETRRERNAHRHKQTHRERREEEERERESEERSANSPAAGGVGIVRRLRDPRPTPLSNPMKDPPLLPTATLFTGETLLEVRVWILAAQRGGVEWSGVEQSRAEQTNEGTNMVNVK